MTRPRKSRREKIAEARLELWSAIEDYVMYCGRRPPSSDDSPAMRFVAASSKERINHVFNRIEAAYRTPAKRKT